MNILSLCDGQSCGQIALERVGINVDTYYASEIEENPIKITQYNYPNTIQLGDMTKIDLTKLPKIDLILSGTPCQGFSRNGKMLNFEDERSKLFFDFSRILKYIKENNNPNVKFLLENVEMKKEWKKIINEELGVEGQLINSKLVSAQSRPRVYWTNIDYEELKDKGCVLKNILEEVDTSNYINHQGILIDPQIKEKSRNLINVVDGEVRISQATKLGYIVANDGDGINLQFPTSKTRRGRVIKQKSSTLDCGCDVCVYYDNIIRKFTINELEKLQTLPINYTKCLDNLAARKKAIGNGWTVDVIVHILKGLKNKTK